MQQMQPGVVAAGKFHGPAGRRIACFGVADHRMQIHRHFLLAENVACHGHACGYAPVVLGVHRYERLHFSKISSRVFSESTSILPVEDPKNSFTPGTFE